MISGSYLRHQTSKRGAPQQAQSGHAGSALLAWFWF